MCQVADTTGFLLSEICDLANTWTQPVFQVIVKNIMLNK
jgi:hypothetical protein